MKQGELAMGIAVFVWAASGVYVLFAGVLPRLMRWFGY
jgi:hypothetical protein